MQKIKFIFKVLLLEFLIDKASGLAIDAVIGLQNYVLAYFFGNDKTAPFPTGDDTYFRELKMRLPYDMRNRLDEVASDMMKFVGQTSGRPNYGSLDWLFRRIRVNNGKLEDKIRFVFNCVLTKMSYPYPENFELSPHAQHSLFMDVFALLQEKGFVQWKVDSRYSEGGVHVWNKELTVGADQIDNAKTNAAFWSIIETVTLERALIILAFIKDKNDFGPTRGFAYSTMTNADSTITIPSVGDDQYALLEAARTIDFINGFKTDYTDDEIRAYISDL